MKRLDVVAAIIRDRAGAVLLARRPAHKHQGGLWEFPGGKLEPGESPHQALCREIDEELGVQVDDSTPFMTICHDYPDRHVRLMFREVTRWSGSPHGREGQPLRWQAPAELHQLSFPPANQPVLQALCLPDTVLVLPEQLPDGWRERLCNALGNTPSLVYARRRTRAEQIRPIAEVCAERGAMLMVADDPQLALETGAQVLHLTARGAANASPETLRGDWLLSMACHNSADMARGRAMAVDMALLSPVNATASHPQASPLGWEAFSTLATGEPYAVYAMGGVSPAQLQRAREAGARGVAGIRAFW